MPKSPTKPPTKPKSNDELVVGPIFNPKTIEYRESLIREKLAIASTAIVGFVIIFSLVLVAIADKNVEHVTDTIHQIVPQLLVVYGGIIGFYFGSRRK